MPPTRNSVLLPEGLVFKAHRLVYYSTLGWRVMKKKMRKIVVHRCVKDRFVRAFSNISRALLTPTHPP